jgi:hypothetical protein
MITPVKTSYKGILPPYKEECDICIFRDTMFSELDNIIYKTVRDLVIFEMNIHIWNAVIRIAPRGVTETEIKKLLMKLVDNDNSN